MSWLDKLLKALVAVFAPKPSTTRWTRHLSVTPAGAVAYIVTTGKRVEGTVEDQVHGTWRRKFTFQTPTHQPHAPGELHVEAPGYAARVVPVDNIGPGNEPELPGVYLARARRVGYVRTDGRSWRDETGPFFPLGQTLFWALHGWKFDPQRLRENLAFLGKHRVDFIRILGCVGWPTVPIDPRWLDYQQALGDLIDAAYEDYGLRTQVTVWGGHAEVDPLFATEQVATVIHGREHVILAEAVNEHYAGGNLSDLTLIRRMAKRLSETGVLTAASAVSPATTENVKAITEGVATVASVHLDRGYGDHDWRFVRQPWDVKGYPYATTQNEPKGPASSVSACNDPLRLAMNRIVGIICGAGAYVLHNSAGVFGFEHTHPSGVHRTANLWEMPDIDAVMQAVRGVDVLLPDGIENWQKANTGWMPPNPVHPFDIPWAGDGGHSVGVDKAYCALGPEGQFVFAPCGVNGQPVMTAKRQCHVAVWHPLTLEKVFEGDVDAGGVVTLEGADNQDAAYVVTGRYR